MSIKMIDFGVIIILASGVLTIAGAFILDHFCNGGRALDFIMKKFTGFRRWIANHHRNGAVGQANQKDADIEANLNNAVVQANQDNADTKAIWNDVISELKLKVSSGNRV